MTKRLELYDWPRDYRTNAEDMYSVARVLLLEARRLRALAPDGYRRGAADASRRAAKLILDRIRAGRDADVFYHRCLIRDAVRRVCVESQEPRGLGAQIFDAWAIRGAGLDRPEFEPRSV